jgi:oligopeptide/dipeptide ABC transporter ATP-binding protein
MAVTAVSDLGVNAAGSGATEAGIAQSGEQPPGTPLLVGAGIQKTFDLRGELLGPRQKLRAVDGVDISLNPGETLGLVGESGCGKSTLARMLAGLMTPTAGTVRFGGHVLATAPAPVRRSLRRRMQFIFQDPVGSLDPRMRLGEIVAEGLVAQGMSKPDRARRVEEILDRVGMRGVDLGWYPHQLSGGQQQRLAIARALVVVPELVVADEAVSALDVSVQAQVLNLLMDLKAELGLTYVFVAHNLAVVAYMSNRIAVMYLGKIVEEGDATAICEDPQHPYTVALLSAVPNPRERVQRDRVVLTGDVPSPLDPPSGCRFRTRCPIAQPVCAAEEPRLTPRDGGHLVACHFPGEFRVPAPDP